MTGVQDASRSLTRRNFLKVGAAGAAGLAAAGAMTGCDAWLGAASQQAAEEKTSTRCISSCARAAAR